MTGILSTLFPAQATGYIHNGEYAVSIDNGGANAWDMHVGQSTVSLEKGKEYTVSFDAYATVPRDILAFAGKNAEPWTVYSGNRIFTLSADKQAYTFTFVMTDPTDLQARFGFDIGGSSEDVFIDNVFLSAGKLPTNTDQIMNPVPESSMIYQIYPNPFNSFTTIKYYLDKPTRVSLKIFNATGQEMVTLADGYQAAGEHHVKWTPEGLAGGIYLCKLKTDNHSETKKLLFQK